MSLSSLNSSLASGAAGSVGGIGALDLAFFNKEPLADKGALGASTASKLVECETSLNGILTDYESFLDELLDRSSGGFDFGFLSDLLESLMSFNKRLLVVNLNPLKKNLAQDAVAHVDLTLQKTKLLQSINTFRAHLQVIQIFGLSSVFFLSADTLLLLKAICFEDFELDISDNSKGGMSDLEINKITYNGRTLTYARKLKLDDRWAIEALNNEISIYAKLKPAKGIAAPVLLDHQLTEIVLPHRKYDLKTYLKTKVFSIGFFERNLFKQIALAFTNLHAQQIMHRDVKASNILMGLNGEIEIIDFGLASYIEEDDDFPIDCIGNQKNISPEKANCQKQKFKSEVFEVASMFFSIITGSDLPIELLNNKTKISSRTRSARTNREALNCIRLSKQNDIDQVLKNLRKLKSVPSPYVEGRISAKTFRVLSCCLQVNAEKRPTMKDVYDMLNKPIQKETKPLKVRGKKRGRQRDSNKKTQVSSSNKDGSLKSPKPPRLKKTRLRKVTS